MSDYVIIDIPQRSQEWFSFREGKIGSSDVASILDLNPWETPLQCWERLVLGKKKEDNENMARGRTLEPLALEWFNCEKGAKYEPKVFQSFQYPELIASLDGYTNDSIVEIKCPKKMSKEIPKNYIAQMQHQMYIACMDHCWYVEYDGVYGTIKKIDRDEDFIKDMLKKELIFLRSMMDFRLPLPTERDWIEEEDPGMIVKSFRYKELSLLIDELDTERTDLRNEFIEKATHSRIRCGDIRMQKLISKGKIDYEKLIQDYEIVDAENYRKGPQEIWRFTSS